MAAAADDDTEAPWPVFVIHLARNPERAVQWARWRDVHFVEAVDGAALDVASDARLGLRVRKAILDGDLRADDQSINTRGAAGCGLSHVRCLRAFLEDPRWRTSPAAFVFEDDCQMPEAAHAYDSLGTYLRDRVEQATGSNSSAADDDDDDDDDKASPSASSFDVLLLGAKIRHADAADGPLRRKQLHRVRDFVCLHGALWTRRGATRVLTQRLLEPLDGHVDRLVSLAGRFGVLEVVYSPRLQDFRQDRQLGSVFNHEMAWDAQTLALSVVGLMVLLIATAWCLWRITTTATIATTATTARLSSLTSLATPVRV